MCKTVQFCYWISIFNILGGICGDKCLSDEHVNFDYGGQIFEGYCHCGKQIFYEDDMFIQNIYCCNGIPCNQSGLNISCIDGVTKVYKIYQFNSTWGAASHPKKKSCKSLS